MKLKIFEDQLKDLKSERDLLLNDKQKLKTEVLDLQQNFEDLKRKLTKSDSNLIE